VVMCGEPLGDELREARLVPLPGRKRAEHHLDASLRQHADLGALARRAGVELDVVAEADAPAAPARAGFLAPSFESCPVGELEHALLRAGIVAAVVDQARGVSIRELPDQVAAAQSDAVESVPAGGGADHAPPYEHDLRAAPRPR